MAKRIDLRAYQESIAAKLAAAQSGASAPALLGFEAAGRRWLIDLPIAGEVLPLPRIAPVPLTRPWFAGLASIHGELQAVTDFAVFCGDAPTLRTPAARLLCIGARFGSNAALLVARVHGLKRADSLFPAEEVSDPADLPVAWRGTTFTDTQGMRWSRLEADRLFATPEFLDAALSESSGR